tara:strand:- start:6577 stop:7371 length:795 start_codon:yes stop_codon:yes gene_type:complete
MCIVVKGPQSMKLTAPRFAILCLGLPLVATFAVSDIQVANAQPGMTPPGQTPTSAPPPASPGPAGPYSPAPDGPYSQPPEPYYDPPEPYYGPPMPPVPPPTERQGFNLGFSGGIGIMESDAGELACVGCEPIAATFDFHVGTMLSSKFALQAEFWFQGQSLDATGRASINQTMFTAAAQYWLHPRFWLRAGFGLANLTLNYDDNFGPVSESLGTGVAMHVGAGFEIIHSRNFSLDALIKTGAGTYSDPDETISATTFNLGVNWY